MFLSSVFAQYGNLETQRQKMASIILGSLFTEILGSCALHLQFPKFNNATFARYSCIFHWTDNIYIVLLLSKLRGWGKASLHLSNNRHCLEPSCWRINTLGQLHRHIHSKIK
jgi:hypothetical protein